MEMAVSTVLWKYALLTLNVILSLVGVFVISCGVLAFGGGGSQIGAYITTLLGFVVFTVCFVGCCAALRESYMLSMAFIGTAVAGLILEIIFLITIAAIKDLLTDSIMKRFDDLWNNVETDPGEVDFFQMQYHCCGKESPQDHLDDDDESLPKSCYMYGDDSNPANLFTHGCLMSGVNFIDQQTDYLILTLVGSVALQVLGIVSAYFLAMNVKNRIQKADERIVISEG